MAERARREGGKQKAREEIIGLTKCFRGSSKGGVGAQDKRDFSRVTNGRNEAVFT